MDYFDLFLHVRVRNAWKRLKHLLSTSGVREIFYIGTGTVRTYKKKIGICMI